MDIFKIYSELYERKIGKYMNYYIKNFTIERSNTEKICKNVLFLYYRNMRKIYLIDGNSFIYRMFYAIPEFSTSSGTPVNAVFGMAKFFLGQISQEKPDILVFIQDAA